MLQVSLLFTCLTLFRLEAWACSNFAMENHYNLTVRTMDLGTIPFTAWSIETVPKGSPGLKSSTHGYVAFVLKIAGFEAKDVVFAGINDAGLTCDLQTLTNTRYPKASPNHDNIGAEFICRWALEGFNSVDELKNGLQSVQFVEPGLLHRVIGGAHWAIRDAFGQGVILEFLEEQTHIYEDHNDHGKTGFGIMTNEPPFQWQLQAIHHLQWKQSLARSAVTMPGTWYPDDRFQRIHLIKSSMPKPKDYQGAVMQAVHTLNTVTVPMGLQIGTDSGEKSGEGSGDHTQFGIIYDHVNRLFYWRSIVNQNLQRLRLEDAGLAPGQPRRHLDVFSGKLPWFNDSASLLAPRKNADVAISHDESSFQM